MERSRHRLAIPGLIDWVCHKSLRRQCPPWTNRYRNWLSGLNDKAERAEFRFSVYRLFVFRRWHARSCFVVRRNEGTVPDADSLGGFGKTVARRSRHDRGNFGGKPYGSILRPI